VSPRKKDPIKARVKELQGLYAAIRFASSEEETVEAFLLDLAHAEKKRDEAIADHKDCWKAWTVVESMPTGLEDMLSDEDYEDAGANRDADDEGD
jgi:hypothetical protein